MNAEEFVSRAMRLREQDNYAEAILAAREAIRIDPDSADGWWQLGLAIMAQQGAKRAFQAFHKTTELAPHFGAAWYLLGLAYVEDGKLGDAKNSLKTAFEEDTQLTRALDKLADIANQTDDAEMELWALSHLEQSSELSGSQCNRLGILYHRDGAYARAIRLYKRCMDDPAGWINLGLALSNPAVSQDADAVDALRQGQRLYPDQKRFKELLDGLLPKLLQLGDQLRSRGKEVLAREEKYQHYINPIELLGIGDEDLDELGAKELQRAKRALLQEIELEDGRIRWMDGIVIDRSRALALCDRIASDAELRHHVRVYRDKRLRDFLSKGALDHFIVTPLGEDRDAQEQFEKDQDGFGRWLSPIFAAQYNLVLGRAIDQRELSVVECLLDGRRWVTPEDEEMCFVQAKRVVNRLIDRISDLRDQSENGVINAAHVEMALAQDQLGRVLELLPNNFAEEISRTVGLIRSVSVTTYNKHGDLDAALGVLKVAVPLVRKARHLQVQYDEDLATLSQRKKDEEKHDFTGTLGNDKIGITKKGVRRGMLFIPSEQVTSLRWGGIVTTTGVGYELVAAIRGGDTISFSWRNQGSEKDRELFNDLTRAALVHLMPCCVDNLLKQLNEGHRLPVGEALATPEGIQMTIRGWFSHTVHLITWDNLLCEMEDGIVLIMDRTHPKARIGLSMKETENAVTIYYMMKFREPTREAT